MQITPNELGVNKNQPGTHPPASIDPKVTQLVHNLANKPLLIEKLVLNQPQGLLLKLANHHQQLNLQLPLQVSRTFNRIARHDTTISLSLNNQQQIQLTLNTDDSIKHNQQKSESLLFQKVTLLADNHLKLEHPKLNAQELNPPKLKPPIQAEANSSNKMPSNESSSHISNNQLKMPLREKTSRENSRPLPLQQPQIVSTQALQQKMTNANPPHTTTNRTITSKLTELLNNFTGIHTNKTAANINTTKTQTTDTITVASAAKELLNQHFSKQQPIAKPLNSIVKITQLFEKLETSQPQVKQLLKQINQLLSFIERPATPTANAIKQKVEMSGHLLERNLIHPTKSAMIYSDSKTSILEKKLSKLQSKNLDLLNPPQKNQIKNTGGEPPINQRQSPVTTTPEQPAFQSTKVNDLKLHLMQMRATLESMIKSTTQILEKTTHPLIKPSSDLLSETPSKRMMVNEKQNLIIKQQNIIFKQASDMLTEVKAIISQIESNQLLSLKADPISLQQFLVDLPFSNKNQIDSFELLFEHYNHDQKKPSKKQWKVIVRFDLAPLGPMFAQVELKDERISTHIFAESKQTAKLIGQNLHRLKKSLFSAGVELDELTGSQGNIPDQLLKNNDQNIDTHV